MSTAPPSNDLPYLEALRPVIDEVVAPAAAATVMAPTTDALYDFIGRITCGLPLFEEAS